MKSAVIAFLKEPLLHFLLIGVAVFGLFAALNDSSSSPSMEEIIVTEDKAAQLASGFQSVWRRTPTRDELGGLIEDYIREEVLAREAMALSLDRDDAIIRRRLRQKMEFLTDSAAGALKPSDAELRAYFDGNQEAYASNPAAAFEQVFVGPDPGADEVEQVRQALTTGGDPALVGARTLLPPSLPISVRSSIDGTFGNGFFESLSQSEVGQWSGPIESGYGVHFVRVVARSEAAIPPFEQVQERVLRDWTEARAEEISEAQYQRMLERYVVTRPDLSSLVLGQE